MSHRIYRIIRTIFTHTTALLAVVAASQTADASGFVTDNADDFVTIAYDYSDENFANPERGLFKHIDFMASGTNYISSSSLQSYRKQGITLVYNGYILDCYRDGSDLGWAFISRVETNMRRLRDAGMKVVLRFYYCADSNSRPWDMPVDVTLRHIEQLRPVLEKYSDVIALVEAGFVGVWGEWAFTQSHASDPKTSADYDSRRQIVSALAEALPDDRFVSVRTPMAKMGILGITVSDSITEESAHDGSLRSRVGHHNDCFLANADDAGTYRNVAANRLYTRRDSRYTPMGGETCSDPNSYTELANALQDFKNYHWSYLNADYHPGCLGDWENKGFLDVIRRHLGYRFTLVEGTYPAKATAGKAMNIKLEVENVGWAAPFNPRDVEIVMIPADKSSERMTFTLPLDPRFWFAGSTTVIDSSLDLPAEMSPGEYVVYLNMPDPAETIHDRPEYSIRLANEDVWDSKLGMNRLATITVKEGSGVLDITTDKALLSPSERIYDLNGRCVGTVSSHTDLTEGVYIISGRKVPRRLIDNF